MSDIPPKRGNLPFLSDDIILKIFVKADPKTVGKCRSLSKVWNSRLCTNLFIKQNYKENKDRDQSIIVGIGSPPSDQNSMWYVRASVNTGRQFNFNVPIEINHYGFYSIIGSDNGVICLRISMGGLNSRLLMWNPLTQKRRFAPDEASKHCCHVVSLYAFGYLEDSVEYRIVHVHKWHYSDSTMSWSLYSSVEKEWTHEGSFESNVQKLGPKSVVDNGVVYWIGWECPNFPEPVSIITFNLRHRSFHEATIPAEVKSEYHSLTPFKEGIGLLTYHNVGLSRQILVWEMKQNGEQNLDWAKMIKVSGLGIPYSPSLLVGKDIISVMETRNGSNCSNDTERTDLLITKLRFMEARRVHLAHRFWQEHVNVKTITLHSNGLYMV